MKTYPVVEITFSPTGGTKKVADQISCYLGNITNTMNLIRHDVSFSDVTVPSDSMLSPPLQLLQNILSCANSAVDDQTKKITKS